MGDIEKTKEQAQHDFEVKRLEMMLAKIKTQRSLCKVSVLSASVEVNGFWYNEAQISPEILEDAIQAQLFKIKKTQRKNQVIQQA
tara:strand:- start:95 stop:349 length:255 start_codon:yes stop_codon:yes gene_type:complete